MFLPKPTLVPDNKSAIHCMVVQVKTFSLRAGVNTSDHRLSSFHCQMFSRCSANKFFFGKISSTSAHIHVDPLAPGSMCTQHMVTVVVSPITVARLSGEGGLWWVTGVAER